MKESFLDFITRRMYEIEASGASEHLTGQIVAFAEIKRKFEYSTLLKLKGLEIIDNGPGGFTLKCKVCPRVYEPTAVNNIPQRCVTCGADLWVLEEEEPRY